MLRIWIDNTYYITVDSEGYVADRDCLEGALGCIIKVRGKLLQVADGKDGSSKKKAIQAVRALKIPRYLADTTRENAFIDTLMQNEFNVTQKMFSAAPAGGLSGLLRADGGAIPFTRNTIPAHVKHGPFDDDEACVELQDGVLVFSFDKSKPPRVVIARATEGKVEVYPKVASIEKLLSSKKSELSNIQKLNPALHETKLVRPGTSATGDAQFGRLVEHLEGNADGADVWYTMIPSVMYDWGWGNLQEVVSRSHLVDWKYSDHIALCEKVLSGLKILHEKELLHGDIRPANVMHVGSADSAKNYSLIDYGSFNEEPLIIERAGAGGQTLLGPSVRPERQSPFYSLERRIASEYESADTAFIVKDFPAEPEAVLVRLGWRNSFKALKEEDSKKKEKQVAKLIGEAQNSAKAIASSSKSAPADSSATSPTHMPRASERDSAASEELGENDLIRLREFVFKIIGTRRSGEFLDVLCQRSCFKVLHDRISVPTSLDHLQNGTFLAVPRVIEMRQLTCASDIYSIGVLFLYTVFCGNAYVLPNDEASGNREGDKAGEAKEASDTPPNNESIRIEKEFREFVATLENPTYFQDLWPRVSEVCRNLEECFDSKKKPKEHKYDTVKDSADGEGKNRQVSVNLEDELVALVERIGYTAPGVTRMLTVLDNNIAHFAFFIQFVLCCMHRRVEIERLANDTQLPFCENRLTHFSERPTEAALRRLEKITEMVNNKDRLSVFDGYKLNIPEDIRVLKPAADLQKQVTTLQETTSELRDALETIGTQLKGARWGKRGEEIEKAVEKIESKLGVTLPDPASKQPDSREG